MPVRFPRPKACRYRYSLSLPSRSASCVKTGLHEFWSAFFIDSAPWGAPQQRTVLPLTVMRPEQ